MHHWNLTVKLYSVINRTYMGGLTPLLRCSWCILQPQLTGQQSIWIENWKQYYLKIKYVEQNKWKINGFKHEGVFSFLFFFYRTVSNVSNCIILSMNAPDGFKQNALKNLEANNTKIQRAILNKSWKQLSMK